LLSCPALKPVKNYDALAQGSQKNAEKSGEFFSAGFAVSAFNVIRSKVFGQCVNY